MSEYEKQEFDEDEQNVFESDDDSMEPVETADRKLLDSVTRTWAPREHGSMLYTNSEIIYWEDGKWKYSHNVKNRSRHSDWDVWIKPLYLHDGDNTVATLDDYCCFQDLDAGEDYNKSVTGNSSTVRNNWRFIKEGHWKTRRTKWKRRDN